jgi:hypothetical protein
MSIDGTTYKYEKIDGNFTKNANGEETFPLVVWTDSAFKVSGGCNSNGFDFVYPITALARPSILASESQHRNL